MTHKFRYQSCLICGIYKDSNYFTKFTCAEFLKLCRTHRWENIENPNIYFEFYCNVCGIFGYKYFNINEIIISSFINYYTCNEYLMIKANE